MTWVDLESPTREEIVHILEEFELPELVGEEMYTSTIRSKVDLYENCIYLILHFPFLSKTRSAKAHTSNPDQEIDFIIGKKFIITVRYENQSPLQVFAKNFEVSTKLDRDSLSRHAGFIFVEMMKELYRASLHELEDIGAEIREIEGKIFKGEEEAMVKRISLTNRKMLDFKQAIRFHGDLHRSYEVASKQFFGEQYGYYASLTLSEYNKVNSVLEGNRDTLSELQRTNDSLLSTKTNDIMRTFTIMTFVMIPLSVITGIFGMNTVPELIFIKSITDFFFIVGAMIIIALVMFLFFRIRKWL
jgi:magnesium transporter